MYSPLPPSPFPLEHLEKGAEKKERNSPLMADALELRLILWICLDAETSREDELADGSAEAGKEGVEGLYDENG